MFTKSLKVETESKVFVLKYGKQTLARINKEAFKTFLADLHLDEDKALPIEKGRAKKKKKRTKKTTSSSSARPQSNSLYKKAEIFAKSYAKAKAKFYHTKQVKAVSIGEVKFKHFVGAVKICKRHDVKNYDVFIRAQIEGLKFTNGGKGVFPRIPQLDTEAAETRLLEYLSSVKDEKGEVVAVRISQEERNTPLNDNQRYLSRRERVKNGTASLSEAVYVKELQMIRRKRVENYVTEFLNACE